jgi:uncharacterized membrane protein YphA (DoxX/SURF4 family)
MYRRCLSLSLFVGSLTIPCIAFAHEVYVLTPQEIAYGITTPPFDGIQVALQNASQFIFWGFIVFVVISTVFFMSIFRQVERAFEKTFALLKHYAPAVARITVGIGFLASSYYAATYGPELPIFPSFGGYSPLVILLLAIVGTLVVVGFYARIAALLGIALFAIGTYQHGFYILTYINYLGEMVVLLLIGSHSFSVHSLTGWSEGVRKAYVILSNKLSGIAFAILRVSFGISLLYSSFYAKVLHNQLALQVASLPLAGHPYPLAHYFGFEPHFLVLGAALIEILIGFFYVFGIEIRWTSIFLLFWLMLSLWYFRESVWPHIILIGLPIAFIMHGYDKYSIEGYFFKKGRREPVL